MSILKGRLWSFYKNLTWEESFFKSFLPFIWDWVLPTAHSKSLSLPPPHVHQFERPRFQNLRRRFAWPSSFVLKLKNAWSHLDFKNCCKVFLCRIDTLVIHTKVSLIVIELPSGNSAEWRLAPNKITQLRLEKNTQQEVNIKLSFCSKSNTT